MADEQAPERVIRSKEDLEKAIELAADQQSASLLTDPEWTPKRHIHVHDLVTAFSVGVLRSDIWFHGYTVPPYFNTVLDSIAYGIKEEFGTQEVVELSLVDIELFLKRWVEITDAWHMWLNWGLKPDSPNVHFSSRNTPTPSEREFIDGDAV